MKIESSLGVDLNISGEELHTSIRFNTEIDSMLDTYNLKMLKDILVLESIGADEERQSTVRSENVVSHMVAGAIIGGGIDAMSFGDSIMDGIIAGAVIGYLFAPLKKDPLARVTLVFADGFCFAVTVDRDALNHLVSICSTNRSVEANLSQTQPSRGSRKLIRSEKSWCHKGVHNMKVRGMWITIFLLASIIAYIFSEPTTTSQYASVRLFSSLEALLRDTGKAWAVAATIGVVFTTILNRLYKNPYTSVH
jgi:hypothetical protein